MNKFINNYVITDFETSGLSCQKNAAVEFACVVLSGRNYEQILAYDNIIKPYDEKLTYDQAAINIHGLTKEICQRDGVTLQQLADDIELVCKEAAQGCSPYAKPVLVGHNILFDVPFFCDILARGKKDISKLLDGANDRYGNFVPNVIDTEQLCKNAEGFTNDASLRFKLGLCCTRFGIQLIDAHRAMNDVMATKELFVQLMTRLRSEGGAVLAENGEVDSFRKKFQI